MTFGGGVLCWEAFDGPLAPGGQSPLDPPLLAEEPLLEILLSLLDGWRWSRHAVAPMSCAVDQQARKERSFQHP